MNATFLHGTPSQPNHAKVKNVKIVLPIKFVKITVVSELNVNKLNKNIFLRLFKN